MSTPVSVVVANYNGSHLLQECLPSLLRQDHRDLEVILVDNASVDDSRKVAQRYDIRLVALASNDGLSRAYNRGADAARGRYVFFVNNDMRFESDCVSRLVDTLEADRLAFAADPLQYDWEGARTIHERQVFRRVPSLKAVFSQMVLPGIVPGQVPATGVAEIAWGCAGALLVRKEMFDLLGGWDETFFLDFEDTDLCWRAWARGWKTLFVPDARLYHRWGASGDEQMRVALGDRATAMPKINWRRLIGQQKNYQRFLLKTQDASVVAVMLTLKMLAVVLYAASGRGAVSAAIVRAALANLRELRAILGERQRIRSGAVISNRAFIRRFVVEGGG